jgi:hypothetical protein
MFYILSSIVIFAFILSVKLIIEQNSKSWLAAEGTIVSVNIQRRFQNIASRTGRVNSYEVLVNYSYKIAENLYYGDNIFFKIPAEFDSQQEAEKFAANYPAGSRIDVYYKNCDPSASCLIHYRMNRLQKATIIAIILIVGFLIEYFIYKGFFK